MPKKFEGEVKKVNSGSKRQERKPDKDPDLEGASRGSQPENQDEESPLKTVGGTPIIEREDG